MVKALGFYIIGFDCLTNSILTSVNSKKLIEKALDTPYKEWEIVRIVLVDRRDMVGQDILGIPVICNAEGISDYIQTKWIDSMWINVKKKYQLPIKLMNTCIEMGITVHNTLVNVDNYLGRKEI